ncbi:MAG: NUDIX hydrolase [Tissierellales bacterium]|jgi:8-oxo-dGTP pyrophosphatase MutT (NUDIX family)|nr:NUDIX hydrolase [Tissierellales bacterium]MBN2826944.1 NUDIX hydrolase [Tissierellales bacterium]
MIEEVSAGGIVVFGNSILLLRKFNGDYVLPKGRVEKNESINNAAVREVFEESGSRVNIVKYLDKITYEFIRNSNKEKKVRKIVHFFLMNARDMNCRPQKSEGFVSVSFFPFDRAIQLARYDDERRILKKAVEDISFYE